MLTEADSKRRGLVLALTAGFAALTTRSGKAHETGKAPIAQPVTRDDAAFIGRAFDMRRLAIDGGDQAYGAVVVRDGRIVGQAPSHVVLRSDPTAHAEMEAIRDAAQRLGSRDLGGCTLYSSSRPCPMCEAAAYWAGIDNMIYGESARDGGSPRLCG